MRNAALNFYYYCAEYKMTWHSSVSVRRNYQDSAAATGETASILVEEQG